MTNTIKDSPKNGTNGIGIDEVINLSGGTTTAPTSPQFAAIAGISFPKIFDRTNNKNGPYLKVGGRTRNPRPVAAKSVEVFGIIGDRTTTTAVATTTTLKYSTNGSLGYLSTFRSHQRRQAEESQLKFREVNKTLRGYQTLRISVKKELVLARMWSD